MTNSVIGRKKQTHSAPRPAKDILRPAPPSAQREVPSFILALPSFVPGLIGHTDPSRLLGRQIHRQFDCYAIEEAALGDVAIKGLTVDGDGRRCARGEDQFEVDCYVMIVVVFDGGGHLVVGLGVGDAESAAAEAASLPGEVARRAERSPGECAVAGVVVQAQDLRDEVADIDAGCPAGRSGRSPRKKLPVGIGLKSRIQTRVGQLPWLASP